MELVKGRLNYLEKEALEKTYRKLAFYAQNKYLTLEEYRSSDAYKVKENAIKNWCDISTNITAKIIS